MKALRTATKVATVCGVIGGLAAFYYMAETAVLGAWWVIERKLGREP